MDPALLTIVLRDLVIPEILAIIRAHTNATGNLPTDAEVLAALDVDTTRYIKVGQDFLTRTAP